MRHGGARHWATPLVLAMLCLRAFIPAGFMLAAADGGGLEIVWCDSGALHHHHAGHDHSGHHHADADPSCPYAQSSGPAPLPALTVPGAGALASIQSLPLFEVAQTHPRFGPTREQTSRGPPLLT